MLLVTMMELQTLQVVVLCVSITLMFAQLWVRSKRTYHVLFAIFCGSVAMQMTKGLSGESIGAYQYLIGMGACATCNCYWLLSRSLFRTDNAIAVRHILVALGIALLIMLNQGYLFASHAHLVNVPEGNLGQHILRELTVLLSSCILVLSFWEGCRAWSAASATEKAQRVLFLATFGGAIALSKAMQGVFAADPVAQKAVTAAIILFVLLNTQILMFWRDQSSHSATSSEPGTQQPGKPAAASSVDETVLSAQIKGLLIDQALFLQPNLKIADIARRLDVPEYRVSIALRAHLHARNFNQYVNQLRIKHAQTLLADSDKSAWPVLVVGLESGFASVGPFNRAFKAMTGYTPNQYRQKLKQAEMA